MLIKPYQLMFLFFLFLGTLIASSAESWFTCWLGLEINLMSLIPILLIKLNPMSTESAIKYFLAQVMASIIIMFASLSSNMLFNEMHLFSFNSLIFLSLAIKSGMAPFHFWFPQVMKSSEWFQCSLIITWQKIAPFMLISSFSFSEMFMVLSLMSTFTGALGGLNQNNIKIIITYSSIIHSGWMLMTIFFSIYHWMIYFLIYTFISLSLISCFLGSNIFYSKQINYSNWSNMLKLNFSLSIMSLGGLPPFLGFTAKITAISVIMLNSNNLVVFFMVMCSLVSLFYYMTLIYNLIMSSNTSPKILFKKKQITYFHYIISLTILGNLLIPSFMLFY